MESIFSLCVKFDGPAVAQSVLELSPLELQACITALGFGKDSETTLGLGPERALID